MVAPDNMVLVRQELIATGHLQGGDAKEHPGTLYMQAARHFNIERDKVENILPCTPFQLDVMDSASKDKRRAIGHVVYEIPNNVDVERLAAAWKQAVRQTPALRARIFTSDSGDHLQVILPESFTWVFLTNPDLNDAVVEEETAAAVDGAQCNRYAVLQDPKREQALLIWTFSHALVDTTFQESILGKVLTTYDGNNP
ncbi:hypothetical protein IMZ48_12215 [Candidatus Bathyarchaeota archaeon]|nr:hypothetical protein [Candidatus Bathyarchaeota archaeon]